MADKDWAQLLESKGLPPAPGVPVDAQWKARDDSWWVRTADGRWHWLDPRTREWKHAPQGP
jgi:hypothetical protein